MVLNKKIRVFSINYSPTNLRKLTRLKCERHIINIKLIEISNHFFVAEKFSNLTFKLEQHFFCFISKC